MMGSGRALRMNRNDNIWVQVSRYSSLAMILPASTLVGYLIGYLLDRLFHTHFFYIVFLLLGIVAGFLRFFRELSIATKQDGQ
jgi:F0F1-type ATP synthase assembly protein I